MTAPHRPHSGGASAFSMIEVVLAIGIIAFALVAILGLFPVAVQTATNSQRETQAAFIARAIFNDLASMPGPDTFVTSGPNSFGENGGGSGNDRIDIDLAVAGTYYISYSEDGVPLGEIQAGQFNGGHPDAAFLASIEIASKTLDPALPGSSIAQVEVNIESPAAAQAARRESYAFVSLLNQNLPVTP